MEKHYFYENVNVGMLSKLTLLLSYLYMFLQGFLMAIFHPNFPIFPLFFLVFTLIFMENNMG